MRDRRVFVAAAVALCVAVLFVGRRLSREPEAAPDAASPPQSPASDVPSPPPARGPSEPAPDVASPVTAVRTPSTPTADAARPGAPRVVLRGPWGSGPGQFGRSGGEGAPEAPMSMAVTPDGDLVVLDQVNVRTQRFRDGRYAGASPVPGAAAQDLAMLRDGRAVTLDRLGDPAVTVYDAAGRVASRVPLVGRGIAEGGAVTALFADAEGIYVEREHREVVRVADAEGRPDPERPTMWGRPSRDGATLLRAALVDRLAGTVSVMAAARANGAMDWSRTVRLDGAVLNLVLLEGDRRGRVYLGALVATQRGEVLGDLHVALVRFTQAGEPDATLRVPMPPGAEEVFRQLVIDDDGHVFAMVPSGDGLEVVRYDLP